MPNSARGDYQFRMLTRHESVQLPGGGRGRYAGTPASESCHVRSALWIVPAATVCVWPTASRAARMFSGAGADASDGLRLRSASLPCSAFKIPGNFGTIKNNTVCWCDDLNGAAVGAMEVISSSRVACASVTAAMVMPSPPKPCSASYARTASLWLSASQISSSSPVPLLKNANLLMMSLF